MLTGQKIAKLREKAGLTQEEFARELFVSRELVSKWETNKRYPDSAMVEKIAELFGVSANEIWDTKESVLEELSACIPKEREFSPEELTALLNFFLETLSKTQRSIFISRYYHRSSSKETASLLGIREGNVRKNLTIIRGKFTGFLKENENGKE